MLNRNPDHRSRRRLVLLTVSVLSIFAAAPAEATSMLPTNPMASSAPAQIASSIANCADCIAAARQKTSFSLVSSLAQTARAANDAAEYLGAPAGAGTQPNKNSPIGFTPMRVNATPNWDVFSGQPLPGTLNAQNESGFDPGFHASYWNGVTFQDVPSAPWNQFLDPTDAQNAYAYGELISNPGYPLASYGFVAPGEWSP